MNATIIPREHCFFHFQYRLETYSQFIENWLGFDKYKCLIYGIRDITKCEMSVEEKEIIMLSIFHPRIEVIKRLNIPKVTSLVSRSSDHENCTISSSGDQIAIIKFYCPFVKSDGKTNLTHMFYLFSIETGEMEHYNLVCNFKSDFDWHAHYSVYHCSSLGWLFVNSGFSRNGSRNYFIHRAVFDKSNKTVRLKYVTQHADIDMLRFNSLCFGEHNAQFISKKDVSINIYDYKNNLWSSKESNFPWISSTGGFSFAKSLQNMICIVYSSRLSVEDHYDVKGYRLYRLVDDQWKKMPVSLKFTDLHCYHPQCDIYKSFNSFSLLFLNIKLTASHPGSDYVVYETKTIALCAVINVLPLKVLAMKQIFATYKKFSDKQIIEIINLPHVLIRQFFGPRWRLKELFNSDKNRSMKNSGS